MKRAAVAYVDEAQCIGCTLCIAACPVDAIVGAKGWMHTVVADWCTGCELCVPSCPVDCIALVPPPRPWTAEDARGAKRRQMLRSLRLAREAIPDALPARDQRRAAVADALRRERSKTT